MKLYPYLFFTGTCAEAMEFYKGILGGTLDIIPHEDGTGVMHAQLTSDDISFMASDGTRTEPYPSGPISLSINGSDEEKLTAIFRGLAEGGTIVSDLQKESWGDIFGQLTDKFGIDWMVNISAE